MKRLPGGVVALGFVSMFMDMSSEMIHALLPLYLTTTLGASALIVGLIEGAGEALAQVVKLFSGAFSDHSGKRKPMAVLGYGLSAATKPFFALAGTPVLVLGARLADRLGKGIRGAPRDALVADLVAPSQRGAAYGLRQTLDSVGAVAGPMIALGLMVLLAGDMNLIFALATLPALASVAILVIFVREPVRHRREEPAPSPSLAGLRQMPGAVWVVVGLGALMTLSRISEAFLILRGAEMGLSAAYAPLMLAVMNLVYALVSWPAGTLSDRIGKGGLLTAGLAVLAGSHLLLALGGGPVAVLGAAALWGLHMGLTQGILSAMVADAAPVGRRGTAFGIFNLTSGLALLAGNAAAGAVWAFSGAEAAFLAAATVSLVTLAGFGLFGPSSRRVPPP